MQDPDELPIFGYHLENFNDKEKDLSFEEKTNLLWGKFYKIVCTSSEMENTQKEQILKMFQTKSELNEVFDYIDKANCCGVSIKNHG